MPRFGYTRKVREADGVVTWDVPVELNGTISQSSTQLLDERGVPEKGELQR